MNEKLLEHWQKALRSNRFEGIDILSEKGYYFGNVSNVVLTDFKTGNQDDHDMAEVLDKYLYDMDRTMVDLDVEQVYQCLKGFKAMGKLSDTIEFSDKIYLLQSKGSKIATFNYYCKLDEKGILDSVLKPGDHVYFSVKNLYPTFLNLYKLGINKVRMDYKGDSPVLFMVDSHLKNVVCQVKIW